MGERTTDRGTNSAPNIKRLCNGEYRPGQLYILSSRVAPDTTDADVHALYMRLRVECTLFCNLQRWARTYAILVIGLYELLDNPTTQFIEPPRPWKTWGCQLTFIERCGSQADLSFT
jgi:hypothetical protein